MVLHNNNTPEYDASSSSQGIKSTEDQVPNTAAELTPPENSIEYFIVEINEATAGVTKQWMKLSAILLDAKNTLKKKEYSELKKSIDLNKSTIHKLIKVAESENLAIHRDKFEVVTSWVTLYEIALLTEDQLNELIGTYYGENKPNKVSLANVQNIRGGKASQELPGSPFVQFRVNTEGMKDTKLLRECEKEIAEFFENLKKRYEFDIDIQRFDLEDRTDQAIEKAKLAAKREVERKYQQEMRLELSSFYYGITKDYPSKNDKRGIPSKDEQFYNQYGYYKDELLAEDGRAERIAELGLNEIPEPVMEGGDQG